MSARRAVPSRHRRCRELVTLLALASAVVVAAACAPSRDERANAPATSGVGPAARELLGRRGFEWETVESPHARLHVPRGSGVARDTRRLADSVEAARAAALALLGEGERAGEPKLELFFVDTRDDMRRLEGRPIGGFAQPGELTAAFVAGPGYRPFLRHELTHAIASVRWGNLEAGDWLTEGLAALATGGCQGHSVNELTAGYLARGAIPPLPALRANFRSIPELPGYLAAASVADFVRRRDGIDALRALWQGRTAGMNRHPLGARGPELEREWRAALRATPPAYLDTLRLRREGC